MKRVLAFALLTLGLLAGCAGDPDLGNRFRAERALWDASAEVARLSIRPELVNEATWHKVVDRFSAIPAQYPAKGKGATAVELREVHAHALLAAARIYSTLGDSLAMFDVYSRIEHEYQDLPRVTGEVAFARGRLAESRNDWNGALAAYQEALTRVAPKSGDAGVPGAVMELPLRMARIRVVAAHDSTLGFRHQAYRDAETYYGNMIAKADTLTALDARAYMADVAADQNEWDEAASQLKAMEKVLNGMKPAPRDPASTRYALAQLQIRSKAPGENVQATLNSLIKDYPESPFVAQAHLSLAYIYAQNGNSDQALQALDAVAAAKNAPEDLAGQALLLKAQLLDRMGKWADAQQILAALPVDHPLSEAALLAPIEVVRHYERAGDTEGTQAALAKAETAYRDFLERYPTGPVSVLAQEKLARTLTQEKRYDLAVAEFVRLGEALGQHPAGAQYLTAAAQLALLQLGDTTRAAEILDRTATQYANRKVGQWASEEAARLRKGMQ
jgi:outer membrane protein assembly factor BamD (BamD/ComL family)